MYNVISKSQRLNLYLVPDASHKLPLGIWVEISRPNDQGILIPEYGDILHTIISVLSTGAHLTNQTVNLANKPGREGRNNSLTVLAGSIRVCRGQEQNVGEGMQDLHED